MKMPNVSKIVRSVKSTVVKHSPEILIGCGVAGMITTTIMAVKATPKALECIEEKKYEKDVDELTPVETIKATWKCYIPAFISGALSVGCIITGSSVNVKRKAALATAYTLAESSLKEYQEKVIETIGEKKEQAVRDNIAKDRIEKNPVHNTEVFITEKGNTLCYDGLSGRYFRSDQDKIKKVINELNARLITEMYISLNEFYYELGLNCTKLGNELGWNINDGLIEPSFSAQISDSGEPCIAIDYLVAPRYNYSSCI